ncbi:methionyl-tRNA formyltransferase [Corynebacterium macginleyi]|uniref:methionyl-tRNA formyltransferase n=1 Tax=Corynebacterium macginleyi TaxID=38290 RepID=UPI00190DC62A|nr:methionyl-tRNA formyltransferase [Corynebacterium macginleyi]MBK4166689.1 methionyl-tRNA formyltransferase [Corynebacterium macginleyi]QRJ58852.1 methionyl-tRNA formyltransferase [Corynebacterium macginleyi]
MRIIFAGTPEPALVALEKLLASSHEVVAVITRPDAKKGRGRSLHPSPVKVLAQKHGIEVLTPATLRPGTEDGDNLRQRLSELQPEAIPVVAYGNLISKDLLNVPRHGWVNLHFSLLPAWRGAAPVQAAIAAGDDITGASTFRIEEGLDTGPVFGTVTEGITGEDTADDLLTRLSYSGADLLVATMDGLAAGTLDSQPQSGEATYATKISTAAARIDWAQPACAVDRHIRAHTPSPGAWTLLEDARLKIGPVLLTEGIDEHLAPGEALISKDVVYIGTATHPVQLDRIQPPGKKMMNAADWARGLGKNAEVSFQ